MTDAGDLVLDGVSRSFRTVLALDRVGLEVPGGERVAVIGPSGSGKTTLLRVIAGFEPIDAGRITIGGVEVSAPGRTSVPAHRRGIGYVAQDGALFPHLSVADNIAFGLRGGSDRRGRILELLELVSLDAGIAERRPDQLSGGQQQRVSLARAMAVRPRLLLLDEPFSALDADLRIQTREAITAIVAASRTTALLVTHDPDDAAAFGQRTVVMDAGRSISTQASTPRYGSPPVCPTCGQPVT